VTVVTPVRVGHRVAGVWGRRLSVIIMFHLPPLIKNQLAISRFIFSSFDFISVLFGVLLDTQRTCPQRTFLHKSKKDWNENQDVNR
jgi:hypothetical protein